MIRYFAAHPTAGNLLMLFLVVIGLFALPNLKRETFPDFTPQEIEVRVGYPGASVADVEESLCQRLEDAVDGINNLEEFRCQAIENVAIFIVRMKELGQFPRFFDDVKTEIDAIDDFPDLAEAPVIKQLGQVDQVVSIAITGPMSVSDLSAYAQQIKFRLKQLPNISQVKIRGFSQHQLRIRVSALSLQQYGLNIQSLADIIKRQSVNLPAGNIETREREILLRFSDQRRSLGELSDLVIIGAQENNGEIRLGEIATLEDQFERAEEKILFNGQRAALLQITKTKSEDTLDVVTTVKQFVQQAQQTAPPNVTFNLTQDVSSIVQDRLQMLTKNGLQGLVLVFLVMWMFFQFRFAFWVAMGLPVAFLGGLFFISLLGYSINMISMVALLIALGLLMDDAIVIAENIATHLRAGKSALNAAIDGTKQVAPGVLSSFLTTTAVFVPLAFLSGDIGKVLMVIPVVLVIVLAVSLLEAFLILPHHLKHALEHQSQQTTGRYRQRFDDAIDFLRDRVLGGAIDTVIKWRYLFIGIVISIFLGSIGMLAGGHLKFVAFPNIEGDVIEARILLTQGTPLWRTEAVVEQLTDALKKVDEEFTPKQVNGQKLIRNINVQFNKNQDANGFGAHIATISVDLLSAETRVGHIDDILQRWREFTGPVADSVSINYKEPHIGPAGRAIDIRLYGQNFREMKAASMELQAWLNQYSGVLDISDDLRSGKPELQLRLRDGSFAMGVDAATIATQLRASIFGDIAYKIQVGAESYDIQIKLDESDINTIGELRDFRIVTANGKRVPLSAIAILTSSRGYARIHRIDGKRTVTITGDVNPLIANAQQIIKDTNTLFLPILQKQYPNIIVDVKGQTDESAKTGSSMRNGFIIGLLCIFILLSFQFRSYLEPLAVMSAIPLALIGIIWGHIAMGLELSMPSMMGAVSLAGIVVNDSILLIEFLKMRAREGLSIPEAAKTASRERFRAVFLTSLTTIAGLVPLLMEKSLQAQVLVPLATSIVFGLLISTLLVLLVVPALFSVFSDFGWVTTEKEIADE